MTTPLVLAEIAMRCASALSTATNPQSAVREVIDRVAADLDGDSADLAVVFVSSDMAKTLDALSAELKARGLGRHVLGCTGESIVGDGREVEGSSAISLWSICLPGVAVEPVRLEANRLTASGWPDGTASNQALLMLADPFTFPTENSLAAVRVQSPGLRVIGGMASAGRSAGENRLLLDGEVFVDGAVGVHLNGPISIRSVVSQGCRPIGRPLIVTRAERNLIAELGRRPALEVLREIFEELDEDDQDRVREGLHVGRVINEYQETFGRGDFLIRNVIGADASQGIAITDVPRVGQTVQFQVRDAETADEDLRNLLSEPKNANGSPAGALLFSCNGRGTRLFSTPDHDVGVLRELLGPIPVAGFFAMGEIGPVGGQNFVHGFTASVAIFEEA